jgi:hypothetical protein
MALTLGFACLMAFNLGSDSGPSVQATAEKPVFFSSYCQEVTDPYESLILAVWRDGRVVWRDPKAGIGPVPSSYVGGWYMGKYFEGQVSPERVRAAITEFAHARLLGNYDLVCGMWPTPSPRRLEITDRGTGSVFALDNYNYLQPESRRAQKVWNKLNPTLMPKEGRLTTSPDTSEWW